MDPLVRHPQTSSSSSSSSVLPSVSLLPPSSSSSSTPSSASSRFHPSLESALPPPPTTVPVPTDASGDQSVDDLLPNDSPSSPDKKRRKRIDAVDPTQILRRRTRSAKKRQTVDSLQQQFTWLKEFEGGHLCAVCRKPIASLDRDTLKKHERSKRHSTQMGLAPLDELLSASILASRDIELEGMQLPTVDGVDLPRQDVRKLSLEELNRAFPLRSRAQEFALKIKKLSEHAVIPSRQTPGAAGYDLHSAVEMTIPPRSSAVVPLDLVMEIPSMLYGRIAGRSGLATKHSIDVGAGVIDSDYRGPVGVVLFNHSDKPFLVEHRARIAQLILEFAARPNVVEVEDITETQRGEGGFGHTGE
eukprot:TRINITY_DN10346_c0_g1_i1.p1 TRINITY_DN10346_c0_g1~~TRINITY_DN10346_c0_g1_i1.p1  ORF type:complete len:359 (-),score=109.36 TRINITY_DN10346_c0_g1_i1:374-1450(-)